MSRKKFECLRCGGTGDEPGAPERPGERALCIECNGAGALPRRKAILQLVKEQREEDGAVEIDDNAKFSEGDDDGCYVQAWVWCDFAGTDLSKEK